MATLALGAIGAAIGSSFGGIAALGLSGSAIGWSIGSFIGGRLFAPDLPNLSFSTSSEGPRLSDLSVGGSSYASPVVEVFGSMRVPGNIIWADDLVEVVNTDTQTVTSMSSGGKGLGGGGSQTSTSTATRTFYTYNCSFAVLACAGPVYGIRRMWLDKGLVFHLGNDADAGTVSQSNAFLAQIARYPGNDSQTADPTIAVDKGAQTPGYRGRAYTVFRDLDLTARYGNRLPTVEIEVVESGQLFGGNQITRLTRSVAHIIQTLCARAGLQPAEVDTSLLTAEVQGYLTQQGSFQAKLQPLLDAFAIDAVLSGNQLAFRPRETASVATIPAADLSAGPEITQDALSIIRTREQDLPRMVQVDYYDIDRDYQPNSQIAQRVVTNATSVMRLTLNAALTATQARTIAERTLYSTWMARTRYRWTLSYRYVRLEPGDVVTIDMGAVQHVVKITRVTYGANQVLELEGVAHDQAVYSAQVTGSTGQTTPQGIPDAGAATTYLLNLPPLLSSHDGLTYYAGATSANPAFLAATLLRSLDGGTEYNGVALLAPYVTAGTADTELVSHGWHTWDTDSTVDVTLVRGTLESLSDAAVLAGANAALLGDEIIQFANADLLGPGEYRLSRLLRGRRGTEWAVGLHEVGERFVMLNGLQRLQPAPTERGVPRFYKSVSNGQRLADAEAFTFTATGESLRPFAPVHPVGGRDGGGNLTLTWVRRDRLAQELPDGVDLALSEASEAYEIDVLNGSTVVRTLTSSTPTVTYTAAQQTADFGSPQSSVTVAIYQMSATVGRGRALVATL